MSDDAIVRMDEADIALPVNGTPATDLEALAMEVFRLGKAVADQEERLAALERSTGFLGVQGMGRR